MSRKINTIILLFVVNFCFGQRVWYNLDSIHPYFKGPLKWDEINKEFDYYVMPVLGNDQSDIILGIYHSNKLFTRSALVKNDSTNIVQPFLNQKNFGKFYRDLSRQGLYGAFIFDSSSIVVIAEQINSTNVKNYQFQVYRNNEILIPWRDFKLFIPTFIRKRRENEKLINETAYLGIFKADFGSILTFEVRNRQYPKDTFRTLASWVNRSPKVIATFSENNMKNFIEVNKFQWKHDFFTPNGATYYGDMALAPVDSLLKIDSLFKPHDNSIFFYLRDKLKSEKYLEYNLINGADSTGWTANDFDQNIVWLKNLSPGNYRLLLRYSLQRQNISVYPFKIEAAWYQTNRFYLIMGVLTVLAISSIFFLTINIKQKRKLKKRQTEQQIAQAEIKSIKSQFNPHFVFNALTSIQGLITKNDIEAAHKYLNDFSLLLRNSLKQSEKEFISLAEDLELTNNYLKLEQLRFGFNYNITVDERLNKNAIEVPVLMLQPVIENAVKHGVATLYGQGLISINYNAIGNDVIVGIVDNGKGFNTNSKNGMGLKITADRVDLLNRLLKDQQIKWEVKSKPDGAEVIFEFKNWLL